MSAADNTQPPKKQKLLALTAATTSLSHDKLVQKLSLLFEVVPAKSIKVDFIATGRRRCACDPRCVVSLSLERSPRLHATLFATALLLLFCERPTSCLPTSAET